jgi:RNase adaptor protein for sRNA GlmZ degradation
LILSASQLSSTKKNEQEHLSLSLGCQTSAHCQSVADCQRLMRSLRVAKLQEVLGQFHDVQVTFTSATLSKTPGLLDIS